MSLFRNPIVYPLSIVWLLSLQPLQGASSLPSYTIEDKEEAFLVRRIAEFWKDQDYAIVKGQIIDFLEKYPKSTIHDHLRGILGDLYLQENAYQEALTEYEQIHSAEILEKIVCNKLQALYELGAFEQMIAAGKPFLAKTSEELELRKDEFHFLMAEAYFRKGIAMQEEQERLPYFALAEPLYEEVLSTSFNDPTMFALAEIYRLRNEPKKAASFFTELSKRHPEQAEELLFHAALAEAQFDKNQAIETFTKVIDRNGAKTHDAALNRLILYFQENRYQDVIDAYPQIASTFDSSKQKTLQYMMGRSFFALSEFEKSSMWLTKYLENADTSLPELRNALLMQLNAAQNMKREELYHSTLSRLHSSFPEDPELAQAEFIHAMMLKEIGDFAASEQKLEELIAQKNAFDNPETLYLEYCLVTYSNEHYEKSYKFLVSFLDQFPTSEHTPVAWKYLLASALNLLKENANEPSGYTKEAFYSDLTKVLAVEGVLTPNEKKECLFLQGKIAYELKHYQESLGHLNSYLALYPDQPSASETHLLIALCHHKLNNEPDLFCKHAEAALKDNPELENKSSIHLELYNVYLSLIGPQEEKASETLVSHAADHLYKAMMLQDLPIKLENRLWLTNHYYLKACNMPLAFETDGSVPQNHEHEYARASLLLQGILLDPITKNLIPLSKEESILEWEVVRYANILGRENKRTKKIALLQELIEQQNYHPDWNWQLQKEALIELAKTYELEGRLEEAFETFSFVATSAPNAPTFLSEYAFLNATRLGFQMMPKESKKEENSAIFKTLNDLKEIQIRKTPLSEPLHLDAACEYASIRAEIAPEKEQTLRYMFFLNRIKEDYENKEDPMISSYHKMLGENREKAQLYQTYNEFINAEIIRCQSILAFEDGQKERGGQLANEAKGLLSSLNEKTTSYYLNLRIKSSLKALEKGKLL